MTLIMFHVTYSTTTFYSPAYKHCPLNLRRFSLQTRIADCPGSQLYNTQTQSYYLSVFVCVCVCVGVGEGEGGEGVWRRSDYPSC